MKVTVSGWDYQRCANPGVFEVWLHIMFYFSKVPGEAKLKTCSCTAIIPFGFKSMYISRGTNYSGPFFIIIIIILVDAPHRNIHKQTKPIVLQDMVEVRRPKLNLMRPEQQQRNMFKTLHPHSNHRKIIYIYILEKAMAPHSSTLAWKLPWTEEPGRLQSMGSEESDTTERLHFHFSLSCIGEGNGNPLQRSFYIDRQIDIDI